MTRNELVSYVNRLYARSNADDVRKAYKSCSANKISSFAIIKQEMKNAGGEDIRVLSHTNHFYTCAYRLGDNLVYHTPTKCLVIPFMA